MNESEMMNHDSDGAANALHAAGIWLQRIGAQPTAVAVVGIAPAAFVGVWVPGKPNIGRLAEIDDQGAELCEAVAPVAELVLQRFTPVVRVQVLAAARRGAKLQMLLSPSAEELVLRLVDGERCIMLAARSGVDTWH